MKTRNIILAGAAIMAMATACSVDSMEEVNLIEKSFTAWTDVKPVVKTTLGPGYSVLWDEKDTIKVYNDKGGADFLIGEITHGGTRATFSGKIAESDSYYAVYPASAAAGYTTDQVSIVLPTEQKATVGTFADEANVSVASAVNEELAFRNVGAIFAVTVGNDNVESVTFKAANSIKISGQASVSIAYGAPVVTPSSKASTSVTLTGTIEKGNEYVAVVYPGTYNGFRIIFKNRNGKYAVKSFTSNVEVPRNGNFGFGTVSFADDEWTDEIPDDEELDNEFRSYTLNGDDEVAAFVAAAGTSKETVFNLTIKNTTSDATVRSITDRVAAVTGTLTFEGCCNEGDWFHLHSIGSLPVHSYHINACTGTLDLYTHFKSKTKIEGDLIIENCAEDLIGAGWASPLSTLEEIGGDFRIIGGSGLGIDALKALKKVGGDFEINGRTSFWELGDHDNPENSMLIESIGGNLIIQNCTTFWKLDGFQNLQHIGGDIIIWNNHGGDADVPVTNTDWQRGYCMLREMYDNGVISTFANIQLGYDGHPIDFATLPNCSGEAPDPDGLRSYSINGAAQVEQFLAEVTSAIAVNNLTISGSDVTFDMVKSIGNLISSVEGTLTIDGVGEDFTEGFSMSILERFGMNGGMVIRNISNEVYPNSGAFKTVYNGDFILQNLPLLKTDDGWSDGAWGKIEEVTGNCIFDNCCDHLWSGQAFKSLKKVGGNYILRNLPKSYITHTALTEVGGDFIIENCTHELMDASKYTNSSLVSVGGSFIMRHNTYGTMYYIFNGLKTVGGDFILDDIPSNGFCHGDSKETFPALESVGGDFVMSNFRDTWNSSYETSAAFKSLKTIGGSFTMEGIPGLKRFYSDTGGMDLNEIGGDLVIKDCETLKSLNGFAGLTSIGGNVIISGTSIPNTSGDNKNIGFCILKGYKDSGVIGAGATISIGVDINTLTACN